MPLSCWSAARFTAPLISSLLVARRATNLKSTTDTFGVGTRIATPSSLPASSGSTRPTALAAPVEVGGGLVLRGEDAGALERDIDAELLPRQRGRVLDGGHLDRAVADADGVARDLHLAGKAAMHGIEAQQVRIGLHRGEVVDRDDFDVLAFRFRDGAQHVAADATKSVDPD